VSRRLALLAVALLGAASARASDVESGPDKGKKVPALKVYDVTGLHEGKSVDYAGLRKGKVTVYALLRADKFDRPMNRFLKTLDGKVDKDFEGVYVVAVWLTDDEEKTKVFLPRVQTSVSYAQTALTCFKGTDGPKGWGINTDAHLTVVLAAKGKVVRKWGYRSVNETDVPAVVKALKKARGKE
jgi:hypothetical protein